MSDKKDLRHIFLAARRQQEAAVRAEADAGLVASAVELARDRQVVAAYAPMTGEPGGPGLVPALAEVVGTLLLPVLLADGDLDWAAYDGTLAPGAAGFQASPGPRLGPTAVTGASLLLVPAVAVDLAGQRLGRGGGSYDRALARVAAGVLVLALLYGWELVPEVPTDPHDRPVTGVLLPTGPRWFAP